MLEGWIAQEFGDNTCTQAYEHHRLDKILQRLDHVLQGAPEREWEKPIIDTIKLISEFVNSRFPSMEPYRQ